MMIIIFPGLAESLLGMLRGSDSYFMLVLLIFCKVIDSKRSWNMASKVSYMME